MYKMILTLVFAFYSFTVTAEPIKIAALGDSLTQGYGLAQSDGFVPQLEEWLQAQGADVVLINAGVSGDTTAGGAARVDWTLTPDVDAMIVTLGGNDLLRGIAPSVARDNLDTILRTAYQADVAVLLVGLSAPGNYGPDYKAEFDAIYPDLAEKYGALYSKNFLSGVVDADGRASLDLMQRDGIHPNAKGVVRIVSVLGPDVLALIQKAEADK
jgi:acyl-CoA thioesterase-1